MSVKLGEIVRELMIRDGNSSQMNRPKYLSFAKSVVNDLNLFTLRNTKKMWIAVKSAKYINLPTDLMKVSTISVEVDDCIIPLCFNSDVRKDGYIEHQNDGCGCSKCSCSSPYCGANTMKQVDEEVSMAIPINRYIPIVTGEDTTACDECELTEGTLPEYETNDTEYTKTVQTLICQNGDVVRKICEPTAKYLKISGIPIEFKDGGSACNNCETIAGATADYVYDGIETVCREEHLCSIEVLPCGCPANTTSNNTLLQDTCGEKPCDTSMSDLNIYEDDDSRLYFPADFPHSKVLVKYFYNFNYSETLIPEFAKETVMLGIEYKMKLRDKRSLMLARELRREYHLEERKVRMVVSRLRNGELLSIILGNQNELRNG